MLKTKIVCTIGPSSNSKETLETLIKGGMTVARINMAHSSFQFAENIIKIVREFCTNSTFTCAVWIDVNGPKVRSGKLANGNPVELHKGDNFFFLNDPSIIGDATKVSTSYTKQIVSIGDLLCVDDGNLEFIVAERLESSIRTIVQNNGVLGENKGITFPQYTIEDLPALSAKDRDDVRFAVRMDVDFVSVSCMRDIDDVEELSPIKMWAKIENKRGMDNYESILKMADGVVLDRGYLGAEVDVDLVVIGQKRMIALANTAGKPILIANQVLESMVNSPRCLRSEAADIANAVMDGADGLVLSSETAVGQYVVEVLQAEKSTNYLEYQMKAMRNVTKPIHINESIASSAVLCARQVGAALIVCFTELGGTARLVAKYRPLIPVIAATEIRQTARQLSAIFGLVPYYHSGLERDCVRNTLKFACEMGLAKPGQTAVFTSGQVVGFAEGTTTKMQVVVIPDYE